MKKSILITGAVTALAMSSSAGAVSEHVRHYNGMNCQSVATNAYPAAKRVQATSRGGGVVKCYSSSCSIYAFCPLDSDIMFEPSECNPTTVAHVELILQNPSAVDTCPGVSARLQQTRWGQTSVSYSTTMYPPASLGPGQYWTAHFDYVNFSSFYEDGFWDVVVQGSPCPALEIVSYRIVYDY
jgi:hypothetical protein